MPIKKQNRKLKKRARPKTDGQKNATKQDVRRLGVMVGAMGVHIRLVAEQYGGIKKDIGNMKEDIGGIKQEIGEIKEDIGGIKQEIGEIRQTLDGHTEMIGSLMIDMTKVKGLLEQKADQADVAVLSQRVLAVERN